MMARKVVGLGFEIISKLDSYFLMIVMKNVNLKLELPIENSALRWFIGG